MSMKVVYIANARIPTEKAHGVQIMKMCEAYAAAGADVELIVPRRRNAIATDPFKFYGIANPFRISYVSTLDWLALGTIGFVIQRFTFAVSALSHVRQACRADRAAHAPSSDAVIISREVFPTLWLARRGYKTVYEMHDFPQSRLPLHRRLCRTVSRVVTTSKWSRDHCISEFAIPAGHILHYPNGVDLSAFDTKVSREEARAKLGLSGLSKIVLYGGHLYDWKGAHILAEAAPLLPAGTTVVFVGGTDADIAAFKVRHPGERIKVLGRKPHTDIPLYLKAADVLVVPNIPSTPHSTYSTSPIKLFEYMASRRPIVASDMPSLRELLSEANACLVPPGDAAKLAAGIYKVLNDQAYAEGIAAAACQDVQKWSWSKRAAAILSFIAGL